MKAVLISILLLVSQVAFANYDQQELPPYNKTYNCNKYTINEVSQTEGFLTDNPIQAGETIIEQTNSTFTIKQNIMFKADQEMVNPAGGTSTGFAFNKGYLFFKRRNVENQVYFLVYESKLPSHLQNGIPNPADVDRLIAIADCTEI